MRIYPVFIPQQGCPYQCIYCNQFDITGSDSINPEKLKEGLHLFKINNPNQPKEIAFFGGTFTALPIETRKEYYQLVKPFLDTDTHIRYSTRPDCISEEILVESIDNQVRTVELGIQSFDNDVLKKSSRNYTCDVAIKASKLIKNSGLSLGIQLMPGLPGYSKETLEKTIKTTVDIKPDFVRIYPLLILKETPLELLYNRGLYTPLTLEQALYDSVTMIENFEKANITIAKVGLHSDIVERDAVIDGPFHPNFGELVKGEILIRDILKSMEHDCRIEVSEKNISLLYGNDHYILKQLYERSRFKIQGVSFNKELAKGNFSLF